MFALSLIFHFLYGKASPQKCVSLMVFKHRFLALSFRKWEESRRLSEVPLNITERLRHEEKERKKNGSNKVYLLRFPRAVMNLRRALTNTHVTLRRKWRRVGRETGWTLRLSLGSPCVCFKGPAQSSLTGGAAYLFFFPPRSSRGRKFLQPGPERCVPGSFHLTFPPLFAPYLNLERFVVSCPLWTIFSLFFHLRHIVQIGKEEASDRRAPSGLCLEKCR